MSTRTIEISEKNFDINVEVKRDGTIVSAKMIVAHMEDNPLECTEAVKNSNYYSKLVAEEHSAINWNDHGDTAYDSFKDQMAEVFGGKLA